jgi:HD-GYP domain-containing protein (c-di-GMP phosphodiesterase class II)
MLLPPPRLLALIVALTLAAVAALALALWLDPPRPDRTTLIQAGLLLVMVVLARRFPVQLAPKTKTIVDTTPLYAATLLLPVPLAMLVAGGAAAMAEADQRVPWFQTVFNVVEVALRVGAGAAVLIALAGTGAMVDLGSGRWLYAAPATAVTMYLVNGGLVDLVVGVQLGRPPVRDWWRRRRFDLPHEASLYLLGLFAAVLGARYPWALALLALPSVVVYRALRDGVALKVQTRAALEELADVIDMRDHYTYEHSRRVAALARRTAEALGMHPDDVALVEMAGRVHDVGKIGIKSSVLMKPGPLSAAEWEEMRAHPQVGARLVAKFPEFARGRDLVLHHHERYDGGGYPDGLAGDRIPLGARVLAVADAWDAMTSHRAYRRAFDLETARAELERGRGRQFDPAVLDAFLGVLARDPALAMPPPHAPQDVDFPLARPVPA